MDTTTFFIYNKIQNIDKESISHKEILMFLVLLIIPKLTSIDIHSFISNIKNRIYNYFYKYKYLQLEGISSVSDNGIKTIHYPEEYIAISWFMHTKNINNNLSTYCKENNGINSIHMYRMNVNGTNTGFVISEIPNYVTLDPNVEVIVYKHKDIVNNTKLYSKVETYSIVLRSINIDLKEYITGIILKYKKHTESLSDDKLYHFIYQGLDKDENLNFSSYFLNYKNDAEKVNFESFDNLFHEHKPLIMKDIEKLKDIEFYKRTGMKRKKGYLFYGESGTGKTSTVMAISNKDNRHIIEVPMSRVKTNAELERILNVEKIGDIRFTKSQIIILFDEIDICSDELKARKSEKDEFVEIEKKDTEENNNENNKKNNNEKSDKELSEKDKVKMKLMNKLCDFVNLGTMLSRLDGIGNYDGLIIIATTNHKELLDPSLFRELRLSPLYFSYSRKEDIIGMTEKFYGITLNEEQLKVIPDRDTKLAPSKIRFLLEKYEHSIGDFILELLKNSTKSNQMKL